MSQAEDIPESRARGQTAVIAIVLLVGIVAVGSIGILLVGTNATDDTRETAEEERIETAFVEFKQETNSVGESDGRSRTVDFDLPDDAQGAIRNESSGRITIERENLTSTDTIVVKDIGSVVYESDGTQYAYQAGAVWRGSGNRTQMVSAPPIEYDTSRGGGDPTLTFPIVDLQGSERLDSGEVQLQKLSTDAPLNDVATIENQLVTITIESQYYVGWGRYFENRYANAVVSYNHSGESVRILLGQREIGGNWSTGIVSNGDVEWDSSGSDNLDSEVRTGGTFTDDSGGGGPQPNSCDADGDGAFDESGSACTDQNSAIDFGVLDGVIAAKTEQVQNSCGDADVECFPSQGLDDLAGAGPELQGGNTYYFGGDSSVDGTDIQADLSTGNVTVILDGDLGIRQAEIVANDPDAASTGPNCCYLRIYFNGTDMAMGQQSGIRADTDNSTRVQLYGTSEFHFDGKNMQSGEGWHAALYAPGQASTTTNDALPLAGGLTDVCSFDICFGNGAGTIDGAVVAGSVRFQQSVSFDYNPQLANVEPVLGEAGVVPPPITFLHVAVNRVCVGDDPCPGATNAPPTVSASVSGTSTVDEGGNTRSLSATASDPDGTVTGYSWSVVSGPGSVSGTGSSATYTSPSDVTSDTAVQVRVRVIDNESASSSDVVSLTVNDNDGNDPPTITSTSSPSTVDEGNSAPLSVSASDPEGDSLAYGWTITSGPGSISGSGDSVTYDAPTSVSGDQPVTVEVTVDDGNGGTDAASMSFTVNDLTSNSPPTIDSTSFPSMVTEQNSVGVSVSASDVDGDPLSYSWSVVSGGGSISGSGDSVTYQAYFDAAPDHPTVTLEVTVSDGNGGTDTASATITLNNRPTVTGTTSPSSVDEGNTANLGVTATDEDSSDTLSYSWTIVSGPGGTLSTSGSTAAYQAPSVTSDGTVEIVVTVNDGNGASDFTTISLDVIDTVPTITAQLSITQTNSGGWSEYQLDASGSTPSSDIDEYRWDFDGDGVVDRTTSTPMTTVSCGNPGQDYASCGPLSQATVTAVNTTAGASDAETESYP